MDSNINAQLMLDLNQKVKELIMMENIPLLGELFQNYNTICNNRFIYYFNQLMLIILQYYISLFKCL